MERFLLEASIYLGTATLAVPVAARLGFGSVLGFLVAGLIIGPVTGLAGADLEELRQFGEFGVVMMLFLIGLELDPKVLWDMRRRLLGLGLSQILLSTGALFVGALALGLGTNQALIVGMILALSSTAIVLQTLSEKGLIQSAGGRASFAVLLTQDIAVIPMLAIVPLLALGPATGGGDPAHGGALIADLPGWAVTLSTAGAVAVVVLGGRYLIRPLFHFIHAARLPEMYTALALLIVVGIALVMNAVGLSPALGTFLAGVMLANSEFKHELEADIQPFKGLLLGLFFITVGAGLDLAGFLADPLRLIGLALAFMAAKTAVLFAISHFAGLRGRDRWLFTLGLAQAGEFGFVLASFAEQQGALQLAVSQDLLTVIALSMLLTPFFFILWETLVPGSDAPAPAEDSPRARSAHPIIIIGIGRFGQVVNRLVRSVGFSTTVMDNNLAAIRLMQRFGVSGYFGDPTRPRMLRAVGVDKADILVVAVNNPKDATRIVTLARGMNPRLHIIARAHDRAHVYELLQAGADDIVRELFDSSLRAGRYVLENAGLTEFEAHEAERLFYNHDRATIRELFRHWRPDVPPTENEEYMARAIALEQDARSAMLTQMQTVLTGSGGEAGDAAQDTADASVGAGDTGTAGAKTDAADAARQEGAPGTPPAGGG